MSDAKAFVVTTKDGTGNRYGVRFGRKGMLLTGTLDEATHFWREADAGGAGDLAAGRPAAGPYLGGTRKPCRIAEPRVERTTRRGEGKPSCMVRTGSDRTGARVMTGFLRMTGGGIGVTKTMREATWFARMADQAEAERYVEEHFPDAAGGGEIGWTHTGA